MSHKSVHTGALWRVRYDFGEAHKKLHKTVDQIAYVVANAESTDLTDELLDWLGFALFSSQAAVKVKVRILGAEYVGPVIS